jgi:hypothetical protein
MMKLKPLKHTLFLAHSPFGSQEHLPLHGERPLTNRFKYSGSIKQDKN